MTLDQGGQSAITCQNIGGYHSSVNLNLADGTPLTAVYGVVGECSIESQLNTLDFTTVYASHEIAEAVTDPLVPSITSYYMVSDDPWIPGSASQGIAGGEVGDLCTFVAPFVQTSDGYTVSPIWSNAAAAKSMQPCQPQADSSRIYYGAAVQSKLQAVKGGLLANESRGYVIVKRGESATVEVDFFSQAPLPNDATLFLGGKPAYQEPAPATPSAVDPIPTGIQATLSRTTAHNGNGMWLTINVPSSTNAGDYELVIRSVVSDSDYNDWPFIVEVQ